MATIAPALVEGADCGANPVIFVACENDALRCDGCPRAATLAPGPAAAAPTVILLPELEYPANGLAAGAESTLVGLLTISLFGA